MKLIVKFVPQKMSVNFSQPLLKVAFKNPIARDYIGFEPYQGDYEVDPSAHEAIILPTRNKALLDDVTVNKIYYAEVSNLADGMTAYIADHA